MTNRVGAYDAERRLIAETTVSADGVLAEPLHVPAGGWVMLMLPAVEMLPVPVPVPVPVLHASMVNRIIDMS